MSNLCNQDYPNYYLTEDIKEIIKPLEALNISFFNYAKRYNDNSAFVLTTDPEFEKNFFNLLTNAWYFNKDLEHYPKCSYEIWDYLQKQKSYKIDKDLFQLGEDFYQHNRLTISIKNENISQEVYSFCTSKSDDKINELYLYYPDYFHNFIYFFKEKAQRMLKASEQSKVYLPKIITPNSNRHAQLPSITETNLVKSYLCENFLDKIKVKKFNINYHNENITLSKREVDCIKLAAKGKKYTEIALSLHISPNTVRTHIDKIRAKLKKNKLVEIINVFYDYKLL